MTTKRLINPLKLIDRLSNSVLRNGMAQSPTKIIPTRIDRATS
jgi:hypothetical protein